MVQREIVPEAAPLDQAGEPAEGAEEVAEVASESEAHLADKKDDFRKFFKKMKRYQAEGWTLFKIEAQSPALQPLIREWRDVLKLGGAANTDHLLEELVKTAQAEKTEEEFLRTVSDHTKMVAGSDLEKFYRFFTRGLAEQLTPKKKQ